MVGRRPRGYLFLTALSVYALLVGLFVLVRRWFAHPGLAGPLLVAVVLVRIYAVMGDQMAVPQVSPLRLDLWIVPVALALRFGLRHWAVAVALALLCILSRSIGLLYLGGYALALGADFLSARAAVARADRLPCWPEARQFSRRLTPAALSVLAGLGLVTVFLGSPLSDAMLLYRKLGCGQTKIALDSFYWWLLPLTALSAGLAFWKRGELGEKRGGASLLLVGLSISSSIYFFGRSHENNLTNLCVPFLTCLFLCLDLALLQFGPQGRSGALLQFALSSAVVALCAWQYSARISTKFAAQVAVLSRTDLTKPLVAGFGLPRMYCEELAQRIPQRKVYFFTGLDFWYYAECGYVPHGYLLPVELSVLKAPLMAELDQLLDAGYTIALPKKGGLTPAFFSDFLPSLALRGSRGALVASESAHYRFVERPP